jgi:hypothetical protein
MSARASTPAVRLLAEAMIRHKPGSDDQKDGFFSGRFITWPRVLVRALSPKGEKEFSNGFANWPSGRLCRHSTE